MIKYIFYIIFLVLSNISGANQGTLCSEQYKQINNQITADVVATTIIAEEIIDERDHDHSKFLIIGVQKATLNLCNQQNTDSHFIKNYINTQILLNPYLDLPPPALS